MILTSISNEEISKEKEQQKEEQTKVFFECLFKYMLMIICLIFDIIIINAI